MSANRQFLSQLPIRTINFSNPADMTCYTKIVSLAEQMLSLHKRLAAANIQQDRAILEQQIAVTDQQIDRLVYELYGLTVEEIKLVEGKI